MCAPIGGETLHLIFVGEGFQVVDDLKAFSDTEVACGENIEPIEGEDKEHVCRPLSDTFYLTKMFDDFLARHSLERTMPHRSIAKFSREVFHVFYFCGREAACAERSHWCREDERRCRALAWIEGDESGVDGARRFAR